MVAFLSQLMSSSVGPCDVCGIAGAFMSMLAFGSFGAPIKSVRFYCLPMVSSPFSRHLTHHPLNFVVVGDQEAAKSVDVDPLVFQCKGESRSCLEILHFSWVSLIYLTL